jgi:urease accessory protein
MVAVGMWGAVLGRPLIYVLPVVFPMMMVGGAALGMQEVPIPPVEIGVALSVVVLGACVAFEIRTPVWLALLIVTTFAVFHGYAHGRELPSAADPRGYSVGFVVATGLLHVVGILVGSVRHRSSEALFVQGRAMVRTAGAAIALLGMGMAVMASWAGAVGLLMWLLRFLRVTPGDAPDHLE